MTRVAMRRLGAAAAAVLPLWAGVARAGEAPPAMADSAWIHVRVVEGGPDAANVEVHLPLSLVRIALDMAPDDVLADGQLSLRGSDLTVSELRRLWTELEAAGDARFVTIEKPGATVRLSREGARLLVDVEHDGEAGGGRPGSVHAEMPVAVVDALLAGDGERLDISAAISRLATFRGPVLEVRDGESQVHVWIDEKRAPRP